NTLDTQVACNSFTWIDGITYTESNNTATHTLMNQAGCDSIITLDLTINKSDNTLDTQVACNSFTWMDGITYTESNNTATHTLMNQAGCDSVVTLDLTINKLPTINITGNKIIDEGDSTELTANGASSYSWNSGLSNVKGNVITVKPTTTTIYKVIGTDINGCINDTTITIKVKQPILVKGNKNVITEGQIITSTNNHTDFGTTDITTGSQTNTFWIVNTELEDLTIGNITSTNTRFGITTVTNSVINAGDSTSFTITFDPNKLGVDTATISIDNSNKSPFTFRVQGIGFGNEEIVVKGNGNEIANGQLITSLNNSTDFGEVDLFTEEETNTFWIINEGTDTLDIGNISSSNLDFTIAQVVTTKIPPTDSTSFTVTFDPDRLMLGVMEATINITNSATPFIFKVQGTAIEKTNIIANLDTVSTNEETKGYFNILANDIGGNFGIDTLSFEIIKNVTNGEISYNEGIVTYSPDTNFFGKDSLFYKITGNNGTTDSAYAIITVKNVIDPIIISNVGSSVVEEDTLIMNVLLNVKFTDLGIDTSSLKIIERPLEGNATINDDGTISYIGRKDFFGDDQIQYILKDKNGTSDTAYYYITVENRIDTIVTNGGEISMHQGTVTFDVIKNTVDVDFGLDMDSLKAISGPFKGTLEIDKGIISYTANDTFFGKDSIQYVISGKNGTSDTAYLRITVKNVFAGNDTTSCAKVSNLNAVAVIGGTWTLKSGNAEIDNPSNPDSQVTFFEAGKVTFTWSAEIDDELVSDDVIIDVLDVQVAQISIDNSINIITDSIEISSIGDNDDILWKVEQGNGKIDNDQSSSIKITELSEGINQIVLLDNDICATTDTLIINYSVQLIANAGDDQLVCEDTTNLSADYNFAKYTQGIWRTVNSTTAIIADSTNPSTKISNLNEGINKFVWTVSHINRNESVTDTVIITSSRTIPTVNNIDSITTKTQLKFALEVPNNDYDTYTYSWGELPKNGISFFDLADNVLEYFANRKYLGRDSVTYSVTNQCDRSVINKITLSIGNSAPINTQDVGGEGEITIKVGEVSSEFNILDSIYIYDNNYDIDTSSFKFTGKTFDFGTESAFGAIATVGEAGYVVLDYQYIVKVGLDSISYTVCDVDSNCLESYLKINVTGVSVIEEKEDPRVKVYNVLSPNGDGKHDFLFIENLFDEEGNHLYPDNKLTIFDRWGKIVTHLEHYDNEEVRWEGHDDTGNLVQPGTYYYGLQLDDDSFQGGYIIVNYQN
ncbi:MAG: choice-of-anchor D domain-containing protein, partial [Cytophagales bacterium]|nr:choice-of-anchor D domain-containing protein [Cytophagales bacterium]